MRMMCPGALCRRWKPSKGPNSNVWWKNRESRGRRTRWRRWRRRRRSWKKLKCGRRRRRLFTWRRLTAATPVGRSEAPGSLPLAAASFDPTINDLIKPAQWLIMNAADFSQTFSCYFLLLTSSFSPLEWHGDPIEMKSPKEEEEEEEEKDASSHVFS